MAADREPKRRSAETRERWAASITARAREHWTPQRRQGLLGGMRLLCPPWEAAPLLRALRLLRGDASMPPESVRKYMQVSHMATLLEPPLRRLAESVPRLRSLDAGCGSSYLTLVLAWCARRRWNRPVEILASTATRRLSGAAGAAPAPRGSTTSRASMSASWGRWTRPGPGPAIRCGPAEGPVVHVLVAPHACDTASGTRRWRWCVVGAELIAAAPCCQAELARVGRPADAGASGPFGPVWRSPTCGGRPGPMTDALCLLLLRGCGYDTTATEFVGAGHTPKNTLPRAVRTGVPDAEAVGESRCATRRAAPTSVWRACFRRRSEHRRRAADGDAHVRVRRGLDLVARSPADADLREVLVPRAAFLRGAVGAGTGPQQERGRRGRRGPSHRPPSFHRSLPVVAPPCGRADGRAPPCVGGHRNGRSDRRPGRPDTCTTCSCRSRSR